jgi:hypothetical protein
MFKLLRKIPNNKQYFPKVKYNIWKINNIDLLHKDTDYINNYQEPFILCEIPPPPFCSMCNRYITKNKCYSKKFISKYNSSAITSYIKPIYCPVFENSYKKKIKIIK